MKTLEPIDQRYNVEIPDAGYWSEFEVQAHLFNALRARGYDVRGEVSWRGDGVHCRFDLVMFKDGKATRIFEVKKRERKKPRAELEDTRQGRRYRLFGVPVTFIYGIDDACNFLMEDARAHRD